MSKFIDSIVGGMNYDYMRTPKRLPRLTITESYKDLSTYTPLHYEYTFGVNWSVKGVADKRNMEALQKNAIRQLKHDVYGEFLEKLYQLEQAIYEQDDDKSYSLIRDIVTEVNA